jgi:hypothetical protein
MAEHDFSTALKSHSIVMVDPHFRLARTIDIDNHPKSVHTLFPMSQPPTPETEPHWARPLHERQIAMLGELAEAGLVLALAAKDLATPPEGCVEPAVLEGLTRAYGRAARAVRLSLMLQDRLIKELTAFDKRAAQDAAWDLGQDRRARKGLVERIVGRVIAGAHDDDDAVDRLAAETAERLDHEDLYGPILDRPVGELVAMICRDLGLAPDWAGLSQEAWAVDEAAGDIASGPLEALAPGLRPVRAKHEDREDRHKGHKDFASFVPPS